jgi:hypothetical protein
MTGKIYCIENLENGKKYIGKTTRDLTKRISIHLCTDGCRKISNALKKYGRESFAIDILWESEEFTNEQINMKEIEFIKIHNTLHPNGYNLTSGGDGGYAPSVETRKLISKKVKDAWLINGERWIKERRERGTSDETRLKMSNSLKERHRKDPEFANQLGNKVRGREVTKETRLKISEANKQRSPELIKEISKKRQKALFCFNSSGIFIKKYDAVRDVDNDGFSNSSVRYSIKKQKMYKGFYFSYSSILPFVPT